ncbi:MAG: hypothetical protein ACQEWU_11545 [Bacillota bacterium]|uniref:Uncharacterized protein n=1 Tax=Virgibacillus salarius TaxID=447199 RepID=A0A941DSA6_9BACI|nr:MULTISPECIES: hypothetical protein [Virgibacillus]NAZ08902.1 hypothetical protein [Agaribacter marinus]MBR7796194.1 hypothetical protein [Virgibacillus salarius]MCC2249707.1 hypothetical protein [Virgibacillus sp. AGTR]MDY7042698.1 hypothetical protein [Virgibacillus sp. M23]QRZ17152.1 hypothetical protein JUJ52_15380 [Virgibacillus sp. AGTR]
MNKINVGISFLYMATFLYGVRYISGAMGVISSTEWSDEVFAEHMLFIPDGLMIATVITLILGIVFFVWGLVDNFKKN